MRTEITKSLKAGFALSEEELRRLVQTCQGHLHKEMQPDKCRIKYIVKLRDGSLLDTGSIDDVTALENSGTKSIQRLVLQFDDGKDAKEDTQWRIQVQFEDGAANEQKWVSTLWTVIGQSRDWAFVAAAEVEERIKRVQTISFPRLLDSRAVFIGAMIVGTVLMLSLVFIFGSPSASSSLADALQQAYTSGEVKDPVEALIFLERERSARISGFQWFYPLLVTMGLGPMLLTLGCLSIFSRLVPSYNFLWGDYLAYYQKRRGRWSFFWTAIVIGLIISFVAGLLLQWLVPK